MNRVSLPRFTLCAIVTFCFSINFCFAVRSKYYDLSYSFNNDTIFYPGQRNFQLNKDYPGNIMPNGIWYSAYSFCMGEHGGTHIDAPYHFHKDAWTVDKIPPHHLIDVPAALIDVEESVNALERPDEFVLEVNHIMEHEKSQGIIPFGGVVLIYTGWSRLWPDKAKYLGWDNSTDTATLNFPGLSEAAAKWLADERQIVGIGLDTPSVDPGSSKRYPVHVILATKMVYNIENVANLHLLLDTAKTTKCNLHLFVLSLKIVGGTGSPARILAYCK